MAGRLVFHLFGALAQFEGVVCGRGRNPTLRAIEFCKSTRIGHLRMHLV